MAVKRSKTVKQCAGTFDVTQQVIRDWVKRGCPATRRKNGFRLCEEEVAAWKLRTGVSGLPGRPKVPGDKNLEAAKLRKESALADRYELMVGRERRELVPFAEVMSCWSRLIETAKRKLLALPGAAAPSCVGCDARLIERVIDDRLREIISHLSADGGGVPGVLDDSPEADAQPVG